MGTRHWPEDADECVEALEKRISELESRIKELEEELRKSRRRQGYD